MNTMGETEAAYRSALEKVLEDSRCGVVPKSHLEHIEQLLGAPTVRKTDWHPQGQPLPAGTVCRLRSPITADIVITITYVGDGIMCYRDHRNKERAIALEYVELRPLLPKRERWLKRALSHFTHDCDTATSLLSMYNDGLGKMPEDEQ